ncbi:hypothetical protein GLW20_01715 [Virgibacillus halodenitrificans]|nr:hypothetical protein [Virgibacillus halodenitrificans]
MGNNITILDVTKTALNFFCEETENLLEKGYANLHVDVSLSDLRDDESLKAAYINFSAFISSMPFEEVEDLEKVEAKIKITHRMIFNSTMNIENIEEAEVLLNIEPFIRREVLVFCAEVGIPPIPLPYRFWENEKKD